MPAVEKKVDTKHQLAVDFNIHSLTLQLCIQLMLLLVHVVTGHAAVTKCYIVLVHNDAVLQSARNKKKVLYISNKRYVYSLEMQIGTNSLTLTF